MCVSPMAGQHYAAGGPKEQTAMKRVTMLAAALAAILGTAGLVRAEEYPIAPPGATVTLDPTDFVQYVPEWSGQFIEPDKLVGDHLGEHPGAFGIGAPPDGDYLIGVFGHAYDPTAWSDTLYLWETTRDLSDAGTGPEVVLGFWDGTGFHPDTAPVYAYYRFTGAVGDMPELYIHSSVTHWSEFSFFDLWPINAVKITARDGLHNQVTGAALIPEPGAAALAAAAASIALGGLLRRRRR